MPLRFPVTTPLPGLGINEIAAVPLIEIRHPESITFWYDRRTVDGKDQPHLTLNLEAMRLKYPAEYAAVFAALKKVAYQEVVDGRIAPPGGIVT